MLGRKGVGQQGAGHVDDIRLARGDDLLHLGGVVQAADGGHRHLHVLFDLSRQIDIAAVLLEHTGVSIAEAALVSARGNMQQINVGFDLLGNAAAFFQVVAALEQFRAGHAELDGEPGTHGLTHGFEHLDGETTAVFKTPAVLVGALVEVGGEELVDEPAVTAVDHQHLEACPLGKARHMTVGLDDIGNHLLGQFAHFHPVGAGTGRRPPLGHAVLFGFIGHIGTGVHAGVGEFQAGHGTVAADGICRVGGGSQRVEDALVQMVGVGAVSGRVDHALGDSDRTGAALGPQLIKCGGLGADAAVVGDVGAAHGCREHPVAEGNARDGDGCAQMRILVLHGKPPL